jgi:hypothetical protein
VGVERGGEVRSFDESTAGERRYSFRSLAVALRSSSLSPSSDLGGVWNCDGAEDVRAGDGWPAGEVGLSISMGNIPSMGLAARGAKVSGTPKKLVYSRSQP